MFGEIVIKILILEINIMAKTARPLILGKNTKSRNAVYCVMLNGPFGLSFRASLSSLSRGKDSSELGDLSW